MMYILHSMVSKSSLLYSRELEERGVKDREGRKENPIFSLAGSSYMSIIAREREEKRGEMHKTLASFICSGSETAKEQMCSDTRGPD